MSVATATLTQAKILKLNPWQQLTLFRDPRWMHEWIYKNYGDMAGIHFQGRDHFIVMTPESAREVFAQDPDIYDAFWKASFAGMNGQDSLWVLIGERHRKERLLFAPAVHANHYRSYGDTIRSIARDNLQKHWQPGKNVKAIDMTLSIALDIIMSLIFGVEDEATLQAGRKAVHALTHSAHPLIVFYPTLQKDWFPLWPLYTRAKKNLYAWMEGLLAHRRTHHIEVDDVLGVLMKATDENGNPVSDEHICNELLSVLTAGHMTTAVATAWALYELGRHPQVVVKMREELEAAGADPAPGQILTIPYLEAVFKETVRLHPILSECARVPMEPITIRGKTLQPDQALVVSIIGIHHNPDVYPEPDRFNPQRFIDRKYNIYEFLPFGGGHRRCLGAGLAEYSIRLTLAEAVLNWDFETIGTDKDIRHDLAMGPKYGVPLKIKGRRTPSAAHHATGAGKA